MPNGGHESQLAADRKTRDVVVRNPEIIGEAVKRLSVDLENNSSR